MRKRNNNGMRNRNGGQGGGGRRYHNNGGGGRNNDGQNLQRQKHHATQQREKFMNLARDAQNNGDRVDVEYYLQHVDHYNRVLSDIATVEAERFASQREHYTQSHDQNAAGAPVEGGSEPAGNGAAPEASMDMSHQPRMTHRPRHHHRNHHQALVDGATAEPQAPVSPATSNDIPLPALPPI